jgi:hypothetical protein
VLTPEEKHLLIGLNDGKLLIMTVDNPEATLKEVKLRKKKD